jgi:dienelactone hydrolase
MLLAAIGLALAADVSLPAARPGEITDKVPCAADPKLSYALYLPAGFRRDRSWPILYVFDPRRRGRLGAELFREAAERRGFIVASSNDTESDNKDAPNGAAINGLWADTHARLPIDPRRSYAAGFSGGARLACTLGHVLDGGLAGVIAVGGGFPPDRPPSKAMKFAVFGTVGTRDFNYYEMRQLDMQLARLAVPHRIETWDGEHDWPPVALATHAVEWLDLQAMKHGALAPDPALIEAYARRDGEVALAHEAAGRSADAFVTWSRLATDLDGLGDVVEARASAERLRKPAAAELKRRDKLDSRDIALNQRASVILEAIRSGDVSPPLAGVVGDLQIAELKKQEQQASYEGESAQRRLAHILVEASFYLPRELMSHGEYRRAAACYGLAATIRPEAPSPQWGLARAHARLGSKREALAALARAIDNGFDDRARIESDPDLASIRTDPGYPLVLDRLPKSN